MELNHESIKATNAQLRQYLSHIQLSIEDTFTQYNNNNTANDKDDLNDSRAEQLKEALRFQETVEKFKMLIDELNDKLTQGYQCRQVLHMENELFNSKKELEKLIKENVEICKVNARQKEFLKALEDKYNNRIERSVMCDKVTNLKKELMMIRDFNKVTSETIKEQLRRIDELNGQCEVRQDNIRRCKEKRGEEDALHEFDEEGMKVLIDKAEALGRSGKNEEGFYLGKVRKQREEVRRLNEECQGIKVRIKQKEQEIRLSQIKIKELNKLTQLLAAKQENQQVKQPETVSSIKRRHIRTMKLNMSNQLLGKRLNEREMGKLRDNYVMEPKADSNATTNESKPKYNRGQSAKIDRRADNPAVIELKKNELLIEIEDLKTNIQKALNMKTYYYNNESSTLNQPVILKENNKESSKDNADNSMELIVNYDAITYDYLDRAPYTIEAQKNEIVYQGQRSPINQIKEEINLSYASPKLKTNKYNEDMIVQVNESNFNYLNHLNDVSDLNNNTDVLDKSKLFAKQTRKPFEISNFNKDLNSNIAY